MNGIVLLDAEDVAAIFLVTTMKWCDSNGEQDDPSDVDGVMFIVNGSSICVGKSKQR